MSETDNTVITVKLDRKLKNEVTEILNELGLNHSVLVTALYSQVALHRKIPFEMFLPAKDKKRSK